jgi:hypothetical protein
LCAERTRADVRLLRVRWEIRQLLRETRYLREVAELLVAHHVQAHLQLQVADDGDDVGVAGALTPAVQARLHLRGAGADGDEGVRHGLVGVVVGVDADGARDRLASGPHRNLDVPR